MLALPSYNATFKEEYAVFLSALFSSDSLLQPSARYASYLQFLLPSVRKDKLWQISLGMTVDEFILDAEQSVLNIDERYREVWAQVGESAS